MAVYWVERGEEGCMEEHRCAERDMGFATFWEVTERGQVMKSSPSFVRSRCASTMEEMFKP
jgi:hypothetical protein